MNISPGYLRFKSALPEKVKLVVVSKTQPTDALQELYNAGARNFGENKVQELLAKYQELPKDIQWHFIGHLQQNKVKYIAPFIDLIQSVDSLKLLNEINKQAIKNNRIINCLLQIYIAREESKFGLTVEDAETLLASGEFGLLKNIKVRGLMGMATNTSDHAGIRKEFKSLYSFFQKLTAQSSSSLSNPENFKPEMLSMGMSSDYKIALQEGSTMIRIGSLLFGERVYG